MQRLPNDKSCNEGVKDDGGGPDPLPEGLAFGPHAGFLRKPGLPIHGITADVLLW